MANSESEPEMVEKIASLFGKPFADPELTHRRVNCMGNDRCDVEFRVTDSSGTTTILCVCWELFDNGQEDLERLASTAAGLMRSAHYGGSERLNPGGELEKYEAPTR